MSAGENLRFAEEGNRGDRRRQDDSVVDEIPETENALQMRLAGVLASSLRWLARLGVFLL